MYDKWKNPVILCRPVKEGSEIKVKCLTSFEEKCKEDKDCADNAICTRNKVCAIGELKEPLDKTIWIVIIIIVSVFVAILILLILIFKLKKCLIK